MHAATCLQCTRIFVGPFLHGDLLPQHLDALLGIPCPASATAAVLTPSLWFEGEPLLEVPPLVP